MTDSTEQHWTVGDVAHRLGITRRTLHHYDEIGLLRPSSRSAAGYRLYSPDDLTRLRTIVLWRRLEMPLEEIRAALDDGDAAAQLRRQREAVMTRREELDDLLRAIDSVMEASMSKKPVEGEVLQEIFGDEFDDGLAAAEQQWGDTEAWQQSAARTAAYGRAEWEQIKAETDAMRRRFVEAYAAGETPQSRRAAAAVEAHREHIDRWFYDCDAAMHRRLGDLYVSDPRYALGADEVADPAGLAGWIRDAIEASAAASG